jgi:hypothetical protein
MLRSSATSLMAAAGDRALTQLRRVVAGSTCHGSIFLHLHLIRPGTRAGHSRSPSETLASTGAEPSALSVPGRPTIVRLSGHPPKILSITSALVLMTGRSSRL